MKNPYLKKELAFVVLILFLGLTFAPSINADTDTLTEDELNNPCYMDIPLRYRYINKDGQIRTVTKTRPDFMAERIQSSEEDLAIISANVEMGNHPPIIIDGNDDFTSENGVTGGSGTENDPYIIEDWIIEGEGANAEGIFIMNTDAYFVIRNCTTNGFYGASPGKWGSGIKLSSVENGRIESSTTLENIRGIGVEKNSAHIEIVNCSCGNYSFNYARGIRCDNSQYISIISSECHDTEFGLFLNDTSYVVIENSSFYNNNWYGIWGIGNYRYSIYNYTIKNCKVYNNAFDGINIHPWYGGPEERTSGYIHIANCEIYDNGIPEPLHWGDPGIFIGGLHDNIIENCSVYHNGAGIALTQSTNNIIRNCSVFNNSHSESGDAAPGITIQYNGFTLGYKMRGSHNEITNCDIFNNELGLFLVFSKTLVQKNNIFNNSVEGILAYGFNGIHVNYNNIYGNGFHEYSDGSVVTYLSFADLRHNWWGSEDRPEIGRYKDIYRLFSIAFFRPWATSPIPDAGVQ